MGGPYRINIFLPQTFSMQEAFLQFLWRYQKFSSPQLRTANGEELTVLKPGVWNTAEGPDFLQAKILLGDVQWSGHIEVHRKSSDWWHHKHHEDPNYDAVILHVVWEHDGLVFSPSGTPIPTFILAEYVAGRWLDNYKTRFLNPSPWIPCAASIKNFPTDAWTNWKERLLIERLSQKTLWIKEQLLQTNNDWEAVLFRLLARSFGLHTNGAAFVEVAEKIPVHLLRKLQKTPALEALFLGSSGLLPSEDSEPYVWELRSLFEYLQRKFQLSIEIFPTFKFARLRPANFPTVRWALLAALYHQIPRPFRWLVEAKNLDALKVLQSVQATTYWDTHYTWGAAGKKQVKKISSTFWELLVINCMIPLRFAYAQTQLGFEPEQHLEWFTQLKVEKNSVIQQFRSLGIPLQSAGCSQALLQLYRQYCTPHKCLSCAVGFYLMHE